MFKPATVSLVDTAYQHHVDVWVVFRDVNPERGLLRRWLKAGFGHVEIWKYVSPGAWLRFDTAIEAIMPEVYAHPPWDLVLPHWNPTCVHVRRNVPHGKFRQPFFIGPLVCTVIAAAFLGVRLPFWCRTPYQLYKFLKREGNEE